MSAASEVPGFKGQLVWCPSDPSVGVGVVRKVESKLVWVRFFRLQEDRAYTTRGKDCAIARYVVSPGERVKDRSGAIRRVKKILEPDQQSLVRYQLDDDLVVTEDQLLPEVRSIGAKERLAALNLVHPELVRARVMGLDLAAAGQRPGHAALVGSRIEWLPHQIDVAARAIAQDPVRMLLADEVGLGKTVEAALIFAGLRQEGRANRVLILVPDALCIQWLGEVYRKVHELFVLLDDARIKDAHLDFPELSPFEAYQRIVVSLDWLCASSNLRKQVSAAKWDLVIVDEAHHLRWQGEGRSNLSYNLVELLAGQSRHLLLLTATPMALDPAQYHALLRLLDPTRFDDPAAFTATQERITAIRTVAYDLCKAIEDKRSLSKSFAKAALEILGDDLEDKERVLDLVGLSVKEPERSVKATQVLDSLRYRHGLADYVVRNRRGPVGGLPARQAHTFALAPTETQAVLIEVGETVMLELVQTIDDPKLRRQSLGEMLRALWATPRALSEILKPLSPDLAKTLEPYICKVVDAPLDKKRLPTGDARLRWLVETIYSLSDGDKLLVFVESLVAVKALREALGPFVGNAVALFHRGLSPRDQDRQVAWFRDPQGPKVMLSTEAGGEGRNFQFCHQVVLYDLPWRPATIEQRIGRVDRVGQKHDVQVLVPHFKSRYEAAVLKVMQSAIGVLDKTVGGIDPVLEYVSDQIADIIIKKGDVDSWKTLYLQVAEVVKTAREKTESGVDPILDHSSFSAARVKEILARIPDNLEERTESFVTRYAEEGKIDFHAKPGKLVDVESGPRAAGGEDREGDYVGTFSRLVALDHEDVEFLSFGHPLVEQALDWARTTEDASAALALCRGFGQEGAVFVWRFVIDLPDDVPEVGAYFNEQAYTFALDESGKDYPDLVNLLSDPTRSLERMDAAPLRSAKDRWRSLVEKNFAVADDRARETLVSARLKAAAKAEMVMAARIANLRRTQLRELSWLAKKSPARKALLKAQAEQSELLEREKVRLLKAIEAVAPRLNAVVAVRLLRAREASA